MSVTALKDSLRGVAFTTATPFSEDGEEVLHEELKENAQYIEEAGGELFIPCGNTGEYYALTPEERIQVVESTVEAVSEESTVIGGVNGSVKHATEMAAKYQELGVDGIMIMNPDHTYLHEEGIREYYQQIVDEVDLGVVLYKRGAELSASIIDDLSTEDNVAGVKYAVNDIGGFSEAVEKVSGDVVWSDGIAERYAPAFALEGAEGYTTGIGNFVPEATLQLMDAIRSENWEQAKELREALRGYENLRDGTGEHNQYSSANNVPAVKYGMDLAGLYGGPVRPPLVDLSESDKERAENLYDEIQEEL